MLSISLYRIPFLLHKNYKKVLSLTYRKRSKDNLFAKRIPPSDFVFDEKVADVFDDMILRSIPGYSTIVDMIGGFAESYHKSGTKIYDLGCSLGGATFEISKRLEGQDFSLIAVDNSRAMIERLKQRKIQLGSSAKEIEIQCEDISNTKVEDASVVVLNFTLQFLPIPLRHELITRIHDGLVPGGILVMSEKIAFKDEILNSLIIEMYHKFKESNGYSKLEISQKRLALENILTPESLDTHQSRLKSIGFQTFSVWFQCLNFASMLAIK